MKTHCLSSAVLPGFSLLLFAFPLSADDGHKKEKDRKEHRPHSQESGGRQRPASLWSKLDTDGDGKLSTAEIAQAQALLSAFDADKDGIVTAEEAGLFAHRGDRKRGGEGPGREGADDSRREPKAYKEPKAPKEPKEQRDEAYGSGGSDDDDDDDHGGEEQVGKGGGSMSAEARTWMGFDQNGDGKLTAEELPKRMAASLEKADANGDGAIDLAELEAHLKGAATAPAPSAPAKTTSAPVEAASTPAPAEGAPAPSDAAPVGE